MEALLQRQSVKSYLPTLVEPEKLEQVLEAGRLAPSAFNHQYRRFIVVDDPAVKHHFAVFRLVAILSQYTINHLTQLIGKKVLYWKKSCHPHTK